MPLTLSRYLLAGVSLCYIAQSLTKVVDIKYFTTCLVPLSSPELENPSCGPHTANSKKARFVSLTASKKIGLYYAECMINYDIRRPHNRRCTNVLYLRSLPRHGSHKNCNNYK